MPTERFRRPHPTGFPPASGPPLPAPPPLLAPDSEQVVVNKPPGFRNRQSIILISVIVVALVAGGLAGAELYARHRADSVLVGVAECVVQDGVSISYGVNPPFLWQHITGHYTNISVTTAGDRVQDAKE